MVNKTTQQLEEEIALLKRTIYELHKEVITHRQYFKLRAAGEVSGYTTIPNLTPATAEQIERGNLLVIETSDGTKRGYLSELLGKLEAGDVPELPASKITSETFDAKQIPVAVNSATSGGGFGGFRYQKTSGELNLFVS
ncbi:hypothetical protein [Vibrio alginolyticus]|uniref:hypothetical protein n=1 Tax=Vibrio alginolyticus TaxID=663 RepID=UPI0007228CB5|nr:hypothetical protein [Vibrio alginolyticus]ALR91323.1 hypothetical protein AT730_02550 [Vibrio alginolyticus]MBY7707993.1 hypothetical protein [Vibrio alginolyticus]